MSDEDVLESVERHFLVGNAALDTAQLTEHQDRGSCVQCDEIARAAVRAMALGVTVPRP